MPLQREPAGSIDPLHRYWRSLADGATPQRALIDPAAIKALLPYLYIIAYEFDPFRVRYILTGTEVDRWNGMNLTGRYVDEFIATDTSGANQILLDCYAEAQASGQPVFGAYQWPMRAGYPLTVKFGMYPLLVDGVVRQCLAIEDYTSFPAEAELEAVPVEDPAKSAAPRG
ncbi:MAG: PAS domain-containing protein [Rhodospirillaceae bacterium]|nr:PAS domain-containing protein [Rhodospirillaceae bacterium]